jgi:hypothetical protein
MNKQEAQTMSMDFPLVEIRVEFCMEAFVDFCLIKGAKMVFTMRTTL